MVTAGFIATRTVRTTVVRSYRIEINQCLVVHYLWTVRPFGRRQSVALGISNPAFNAVRTQHQKLISYTAILVRAAPAEDGHLNGRSCGRSVLRISALASVRIDRVARNPAYVYINIIKR